MWSALRDIGKPGKIYGLRSVVHVPRTEYSNLLELFENVRRHHLVTNNGSVQKRFYDDLTEVQRNVLHLLGQSPATYFSAGEKDLAVG